MNIFINLVKIMIRVQKKRGEKRTLFFYLNENKITFYIGYVLYMNRKGNYFF
jgi:hypothetical protein